eukprot:8978592-Pyramimonas_sp.AAC.1
MGHSGAVSALLMDGAGAAAAEAEDGRTPLHEVHTRYDCVTRLAPSRCAALRLCHAIGPLRVCSVTIVSRDRPPR